MSEGAIGNKKKEQIILDCFPNAVKVEKASLADDKNGTDYWVDLLSGKRISIDIKARSKDYSTISPDMDDVALEIWSVIGQSVGWTRNPMKQTDYILWLWEDTGRWLLIPFPLLCSVFVANWQAWAKTYKTGIQKSDNTHNGSQWKSQCVFVPRTVVWNAIYESFGGNLPGRQVNTQVSLDDGIEKAKHRQYHNPKPDYGKYLEY